MRPKKNEPMTFWTWLNKYRAKIGLLAFVIAIPLTLVLIAYLGPYYSNKSVHFDSEYKDVQRQFVGVDDMEEIAINIVWKKLVNPVYDDEGVVTSHGSYQFDINYETKGAYDISSVAITPVLHTDWFSHYSIGAKLTIGTSNKSVSVAWDELFPMRKLIFVTVNEPNLYLKVEYTYAVMESTVNKTAYVKYALSDLNPQEVI